MAEPAQKSIGMIYSKICDVMRDVEAVTKDRVNSKQNYKFRGIDDALNALNPIMVKHRIFAIPRVSKTTRETRPSKDGGVLNYTYIKMETHFYAEDGSSVVAYTIGEGFDSGDKSSGKAMATAFKYALYDTFLIPTEEKKEVEHDNPEPGVDPLKEHKDQMGKVIDKWVEEKWLTEEEVMDLFIKCGFQDGFNSFKSKDDMDRAFKFLTTEVATRKKAAQQGARK